MRESDIQNRIRIELSRHGTYFRANVGRGWAGVPTEISRAGMYYVDAGSVILAGARPFKTGLPVGFSDLFGFTPVIITPEYVGRTLPIFSGIEVKTPTGRIRPEQEHFLHFLTENSCFAGIARSPEDAVRIVTKGVGK
jgi:hypothetical protein